MSSLSPSLIERLSVIPQDRIEFFLFDQEMQQNRASARNRVVALLKEGREDEAMSLGREISDEILVPDRYYPDGPWNNQELYHLFSPNQSPRLVRLRGLRYVRAHNYGCKSDYVDAVIKRYIRKSRITCFDYLEINRLYNDAAYAMIRKGFIFKHGRYSFCWNSQALIGGKLVNIEDGQRQYLSRLNAVLLKAAHLEMRVANRLGPKKPFTPAWGNTERRNDL
jgi:hypothetical protein